MKVTKSDLFNREFKLSYILLVEDNPGDACLIREYLAEKGILALQIAHVDTLAKAQEQLTGSNFDVVLLDLNLPDSKGLDGFEVIHAMIPSLPIVILSGVEDEALAIQAVHKGAQDYLVKGEVNGQFLLRCMRYALERQHIRDEIEKERILSRSIVDTLEHPILVLDERMLVLRANRRFYQTFQVAPEETERQPLLDVAEGRLSHDRLLERLQHVMENKCDSIQLELSPVVVSGTKKRFVLHARVLYQSIDRPCLILISIEEKESSGSEDV